MSNRPQPLQAAPPGYAYTQAGTLVKVQTGWGEVAVAKKLLIVVPYYEGDKRDAEDLLNLICDLERVRAKDADIMVYARFDALPIANSTRDRLADKFEKVHLHTCRRRDGLGYPFGPNQMFFDIVSMLGQQANWSNSYYAFLFLETDAVPTRPGWMTELGDAFKRAEGDRGKSAIGYIHNNPTMHMNGVAVYGTDIYRRVPGDKLGGGNPQIAFDIEKAPILLPMAEDCPLFHFEFKRPTITPAEVFMARRNGVAPAIFHGVKDGSARAAVRARHVSFTDTASAVRPPVFTYYHPVNAAHEGENQSILRLWAQAWRARGFNPMVLSARDAVKNQHYAAFFAAIQRFPTVLEKQTQLNRFLRWLALETQGGGLMTDYDVLPSRILASIFPGMTGFHLARPSMGSLGMAYADKPSIAKWLDRIQNYEPQPTDMIGDRRDVSDLNVMSHCATQDGVIPEDWMKSFSEPGWVEAPVVHFTKRAIERSSMRNERKSSLMDRFLRGEMTNSSGMVPFGTPMDAVPGLQPIAVSYDDTPKAPAESGESERRELFVENERLAAENAELKKIAAGTEERLIRLEKLLEASAEKPKNKGGRPRKVQPVAVV